ncbi:MAG: alpha/beta fold hydrolase [Candidatus Binataceae bacterium]
MFEGFNASKLTIGDVAINTLTKGDGPALLLLHGYPQTHAMWHKIAPLLADHFTVVATDLRGYGDSSKPAGDDQHLRYSKRTMAADQVAVMAALGFDRFMLAAHDRGARVAHRLLLDHPERVTRAALLDIIPTPEVFKRIDQFTATAYYNWFFLIQRRDLPEHLIGADPEYYLRRMGTRAGKEVFAPEAFAEYLRCFRDPACIHATCEDYRAAASVDLKHHNEDGGRTIACPLLLLWGKEGLLERAYDPVAVWREYASDVRAHSLPAGHFIPEEAPQETLAALLAFFA